MAWSVRCSIWVLLVLLAVPYSVSAALLGLAYDENSDKQQLFEIDPTTGTSSPIGTGIDACCIVTGAVSSVDPDTERLYFTGRPFTASEQRLYTMTLSDGSVLQNPTLPSTSVIQFLEYDRTANALYGVAMDALNRTAQLVSLDPGTGSQTPVGSPLSDCCAVAAGISTLSYPGGTRELHFLARLDTESTWRLFSVSTSTGLFQQSDPIDANLRIGGLEYTAAGTLRAFYHDLTDSTQRIGILDPATGSITPAANGLAGCCVLLPGVAAEDSANNRFYAAARRFTDTPYSIQTYATTNGALSGEAPLSDTLDLNALLIGSSGGTTGVSIATSQNPSAIGQTVTFTVTVIGNAPTGSVTLYDRGRLLSDVALSNPGNQASVQAVFDLADLTGGVHSISARYSGDANNPASVTRTLLQTVNPGDTVIDLVAAPLAPVTGQPLTLTANITVQPPASGTPTGSVRFLDNATVIGTIALDGAGQATLDSLLPAVGDHNFTAEYLGNSNFTPSTSSAVPLTISRAGTTITLNAAPDPAGLGQTISLTAHVSVDAPGGGFPEGSVIFRNGADILGSSALDASGSATLDAAIAVEGAHTLTAEYSSNTDYLGSLSPGIPVNVSARLTATSLSAIPNAARVGEPVVLTAVVTAASQGVDTPSGTVTFLDGVNPLGVVPLDASGIAVLGVSSLTEGNHDLTARYDGSVAFDQSTADTVTVNISLESTTTGISASETVIVTGQPFELTAVVYPGSSGGIVPTGTVNFMVGSSIVASGTLDGTGSITLSASLAVEDIYNIVAVYLGDATHAASASAPLQILVTGLGKQFSGPTATGTGEMTLAFVGGGESCAFVEVRTVNVFGDAGSPDHHPSGYQLNHGLFTFVAENCSVGGRLSFMARFPDALPDNSVLLKFAPTLAVNLDHWFTLPATIEGNTIFFDIIDGGQGDGDLLSDGRVIDPAGPAVPLPAAISIPSVGVPGLAVLALLLVLAAGIALHGRYTIGE